MPRCDYACGSCGRLWAHLNGALDASGERQCPDCGSPVRPTEARGAPLALLPRAACQAGAFAKGGACGEPREPGRAFCAKHLALLPKRVAGKRIRHAPV